MRFFLAAGRRAVVGFAPSGAKFSDRGKMPRLRFLCLTNANRRFAPQHNMIQHFDAQQPARFG